MRRSFLVPAIILTALAPQVLAAELTVRVEGVRAAEGQLLVAVAGSADAWDGSAENAAARSMPAQAGAVELVFAGLAPGRYAVQVLHDANGNGTLDSNMLGMPTEGYGFSNNPQVMRKATFDEAAVTLDAAGQHIVITLN
jgi:uncharacterized protein (DUF2141 family)